MDIPSNQYDIKSNDNLNPANAFNRKTGKYKYWGAAAIPSENSFLALRCFVWVNLTGYSPGMLSF